MLDGPRRLRQAIVAAASLESGMRAARTKLAEGDELTAKADGSVRLAIAVRPVFRGGRTWLVGPSGQAAIKPAVADESLVALLRKAHRIAAAHAISPLVRDYRETTSPKDSYTRKVLQLAFLAPDIQRAILDGRQPAGLTGQQIMTTGVPPSWAEQRRRFGFAI